MLRVYGGCTQKISNEHGLLLLVMTEVSTHVPPVLSSILGSPDDGSDVSLLYDPEVHLLARLYVRFSYWMYRLGPLWV